MYYNALEWLKMRYTAYCRYLYSVRPIYSLYSCTIKLPANQRARHDCCEPIHAIQQRISIIMNLSIHSNREKRSSKNKRDQNRVIQIYRLYNLVYLYKLYILSTPPPKRKKYIKKEKGSPLIDIKIPEMNLITSGF